MFEKVIDFVKKDGEILVVIIVDYLIGGLFLGKGD